MGVFMPITDTEKSNSTSVCIAGRDEQHCADVLPEDETGKKRLCVDSLIASKPGANSFPSMSSNFVVDKDFTENTYVVNPDPYELYRYDATDGYLFGFHVDSDTDKLIVQLIIDGKDIFGWLSVKNLKDLNFQIAGTASVLYQSEHIFATGGDDVDFSPPYPIYFSNSVVINISKTDLANIKIKRWFVPILKGA